MAPLWAMMRPSIANGCVFCGAGAPVDAFRTWPVKVIDVRCLASPAKARSSKAAIGCLSSTGAPSGLKMPRPVPSAFWRLCWDRLSGASSSQKRAWTRCGVAVNPKRRHM